MSSLTVEKIGGTSMSRFGMVLENIILNGKKGEELYNRVFVVSAYSDVTNLLLEHKKRFEPGVFSYYLEDDPKWKELLEKVKDHMLNVNKGFKDIGLDLSVANNFIESRIAETRACLSDIKKLCSYGHFVKGDFIPAVREMLSAIGEAHSAFNSANILSNNGVNSLFLDLTGWMDQGKSCVDDVVSNAFSNVDSSKTLPFVTGYIKCNEGFVSSFDRGYSDITLSKIASYLKASEVVVHKEYDLCTADPVLIGADRVKVIPQINYDMADQLADIGMEAIHPQAAKNLMRDNISIRVKNIFEKEHPGTLISDSKESSKALEVKAVSGNDKISTIEVWDTDMIGQSGYDHKLVSCLEKYGISYISKIASGSTITHIVNSSEQTLGKCIDEIRSIFPKAVVDVRDLAIISIVGFLDSKGILAKASKSLSDSGIKIWTTVVPFRQSSLQMVVERGDYVNALSSLHKAFIED